MRYAEVGMFVWGVCGALAGIGLSIVVWIGQQLPAWVLEFALIGFGIGPLPLFGTPEVRRRPWKPVVWVTKQRAVLARALILSGMVEFVACAVEFKLTKSDVWFVLLGLALMTNIGIYSAAYWGLRPEHLLPWKRR